MCRRKPDPGALTHSDQKAVNTRATAIVPEGLWHGGEHESAKKLPQQCGGQELFGLLKKERTKRRIYPDRDSASPDVSITLRCSTTPFVDMFSLSAYRR